MAIVAVDFDGVLCEDRFPKIGPPVYDSIVLVQELVDQGHEVVLWTSRTGERLNEAVEWCRGRGLHFCAVNENAPSNRAQYERLYPEGTRKVYADFYVDDHCPRFRCIERLHGYRAAIEELVEYTRKEIYEYERQQLRDREG